MQMMPTTVSMPSSGIVQLQSTPGYVTVLASTNPNVDEDSASRRVKRIGYTHMIIGIMAFIANGIALSYGDSVGVVGHGFWCGSLLIITGGFGVGAASKNQCQIAVFRVLGICSVIATIPLVFISAVGVYLSRVCYRSFCTGNVSFLMESMLVVLAIAGFAVSVWGLNVLNLLNNFTGNIHVIPILTDALQPRTVQHENLQMMTVPMLSDAPPPYEEYSVPCEQSPAQQPFVTCLPSTPPSPGVSWNGSRPATSALPSYTECCDQKEVVH